MPDGVDGETLRTFMHTGYFRSVERHGVEVVLQARREIVVDVLREMIRQESVDHAADVGRKKPLAVHLDVLAVLERCDDARVGRGPPDPA